MKLEKFKEKNNKKIGIILFTITCIMLISGVIFYRTFAIFETNDNLDLINGSVEDKGDIEFAFYIDGTISKKAPEKGSNYSLDTSSSYCKDLLTGEQVSHINWNEERWGIELNNVDTTKTKCYLYFKEIYKESILNGAIPNLGNGRLIPITIDDNGRVYKADITREWYKYGSQKWANAVILKDQTKTYENNDLIPESNIESYFVWIPRYRYLLWNKETDSYTGIKEDLGIISDSTKESKLNQQKKIQIVFEDKNKVTPSNGSTEGRWLTHPAFTSFDVNGMWVGKFETGYNQNNDLNIEISDTSSWTKNGAEKNENNREKVIIKPNVYSWRSINVSNAFYTSYNYQRDLESHMMKNMEWGAVAYLTNSQYGRCNDNSCTEPRFNNNGNYVTGYSANFDPTCGYTETNETCNKYEFVGLNLNGSVGWNYDNSSSVVASTTGNYYGIYDLSGGAWEYVMGVLQSSENDTRPATGSTSSANSGFKGLYSNNSENKEDGVEWPSRKYYDLYDYGTSAEEYQRGILGDATKENGPFYKMKYIDSNKPIRLESSYYSDHSYFVNSGAPWFIRGAASTDGCATGLGAFNTGNGSLYYYISFRIVLMP